MRCHRKPHQGVSLEVAGLPSSRRPSNIQAAPAHHPCWGRGGLAWCGLPPWASVLRRSWLGRSLLSPPIWLDGGSPTHVLQGLTSPVSPSDRHPGALSFLSRASSVSPQCRSRHSCMGLDTPPWTSSPAPVCPSPWLAWNVETVQTWRQPSCRTSYRPVWCPHWLLLCREASPVGVCVPPPAVAPQWSPHLAWKEWMRSGWSYWGNHSVSAPRWGDTLPSVSPPAWWWCSLLCRTDIWPALFWREMDGGTGSPGTGPCVGFL